MYKRDLVTANLSAETFIDLLKKQGKRDLSYDEFRSYFTKNVSQINKGLFTETLLANLVHYLARDVPTAVNIDKLYIAFQQNPNDPPLQQDGVEELKKRQDLVKAQVSKSEIDFNIIDLYIHMQNKGISTAQMFDLLQS